MKPCLRRVRSFARRTLPSACRTLPSACRTHPGACRTLPAAILLAGLAGCTPPPAAAPELADQAPPPHRYPPISSIHVTCPHVPAPLADKAPPGGIFVPNGAAAANGASATNKPGPGRGAADAQVLQPGHWDWSDGSYVWTPPHLEARIDGQPRQWKSGYWEVNGGACVWHDGRYTAPAPR